MPSTLLILDRSQLCNVTASDEALMREVVSELVSGTSTQLTLLCRAIEQADLLACKKLAHNARGACDNVGAASMAALFRSVEVQAGDGELALCQSSMEELFVELDKLRVEANCM